MAGYPYVMTTTRNYELKLARALRHIHDLEVEAERWLAKPPIRLHYTADLATAEKLILAELLEPVPGELSAITGDALHNLRSALDNLVYDLALAHTGDPLPDDIAKGSAFPVLDDKKSSTASTLDRKLRGVHPDVRALIEEMQPYNPDYGGQRSLLWILNDLNAKDKHRLPPLAVPTPSNVSFYVAGPRGALTATQKWPSLEVGKRVEISRYSSQIGDYAGPDLLKPPEFFVAFGEGAPEAVVGRAVIAGLKEIHKDIAGRILPSLVPHLWPS